MRMLPYDQGCLDGLCGIYSIVNATNLIVRNMREKEAIKLFGKCMRHVEKHRSLGKVSTAGIDENDLWSILQKLVLVDYPVNIERPFYRNGKMSVNDYLRELREYFGQGGKRSAIISVEDEDGDHWTVIKAMTTKQISLFDSSLMKTINVDRCVVHKPNKKKPYLLTPALTFFLYAK